MSANLNQMMPPDSLPSLANVSVSGIGGLEGYAAQVQAQQAAEARRSSNQHVHGPAQGQSTGQGYMQTQGQDTLSLNPDTPTTAAINAIFNTSDFYNVDASSGNGMGNASSSGMHIESPMNGRNHSFDSSQNTGMSTSGPNMTLYTGSAIATSPYNEYAMLGGSSSYGQPHSHQSMGGNNNNGKQPDNDFTLPEPPANGNGLSFDFSSGFGGEKLGGEGMDTVLDLQGGEQGL